MWTRRVGRCFSSTAKGRVVLDARQADSMVEVVKVFEGASKLAKEGFDRLVVLGSPVEDGGYPVSRASRKSLEGVVKSLAREVGRGGATVNLLEVPDEVGESDLEVPVGWMLGEQFKFVTGQVLPLTTCPSTDDQLEGKMILVTGAAGGIGAQVARECSSRGAYVILADIPSTLPTLTTLSQTIPNSSVLTLDLSNGISAGRDAQHLLCVPLDGLVHCAGVTLDRTLKNMPPADWATSLQVNLYGPMAMTSYLQDHGFVTPDTTVVGFSSVIGFTGNRGQTNYSAAKHGLRAWLSSLPCPSYGVAPGFIATPMTEKMPPAILQATLMQSALERLGEPADPACVVANLLSPAGKVFRNGQTIRVCGGFFWG